MKKKNSIDQLFFVSQGRMSAEKFCLKWNDFQSNVGNSFRELRDNLDFCDVTLASEGDQHIKAHKVVLAASSSLFMDMLRSNKHSHPLIYMRGINKRTLLLLWTSYIMEK